MYAHLQDYVLDLPGFRSSFTARFQGGVIGAYGVLELLVGATQLALHEGRRQI